MLRPEQVRTKRQNLEDQIAILRELEREKENELLALKRNLCRHENIVHHFDGNEDFDECLDCGFRGKHLLRPGQIPVPRR